MNEHMPMAPVVRRSSLTEAEFVSEYLVPNQPVIVTGGMTGWPALGWDPKHLASRFGNEKVQVYGDLFRLARITSLSEYFDTYFDRTEDAAKGANSIPYVRWYCRLAGDERVPWADNIFARFCDDWSRPGFFPANSFLLPYCDPSDNIDPSRDWFPARGLFISARGARTRLHVDPWASDALLCQIYGKKDFVMFDPTQDQYLSRGGQTVDIENPELQLFPDFPQARAVVRDTLQPGEILLVPSGWHHHFKSTTDSISLTWNFVHLSRLRVFLAYLGRGPSDVELRQLAYAYFDSPGRRNVEGSGFVASLQKFRRTLE